MGFIQVEPERRLTFVSWPDGGWTLFDERNLTEI